MTGFPRLRLLAPAVLIALAFLGSVRAGGKATFLYVFDDQYNEPVRIYGFALDPEGKLSALPGSPFPGTDTGPSCGGVGQGLSYSRKRHQIYCGSRTGLTVFDVHADGSLAEVTGSPFGVADPAGNGLWGTVVYEKGSRVFLYAAQGKVNRLRAFEIVPPGNPVELSGSPYAADNGALGLDIVGSTVVCAAQTAQSLRVYRIDKAGGLVESPGSPASFAGANTWTAWLSPKGDRAYVGRDDGSLLLFDIDRKTGAVAPHGGPTPGGDLPNAWNGVAFNAKGIGMVFAYADAGVGDMRLIRHDPKGGYTLVGPPSSSGLQYIGAHDFSPDGRILAVADVKTGALVTYLLGKDLTLQTADVDSIAGATQPSDMLIVTP